MPSPEVSTSLEVPVAQLHDERTPSDLARPNVLAYPSPTTSRYLIFATALLCAGLFVGGWVHNQTVGQDWASTFLDCRAKYAATEEFNEESYLANRAVTDCMADAEWTRAMLTLGGAGLSAILALGILLIAPQVVRRRHGLRELGAGLEGAQDAFMDLAGQAGVARRVRLMLGTARQRDAFSFGRPGRYVVALPPAAAVRWRDRTLFEPLVNHELAHVRHRDVALAWLTRSVWFGLAPLLLLPTVVGLVEHDASLLPGYSWRAALLAVVVALVSAALLRSREYDADLRAAGWRGGRAAMTRVLDHTAERPTVGIRGLGLLANHPTRRQRQLVLEEPWLAARAGFVDGLTAAFLVGLSLPLLVAAFSPVAAQLGDSNASYLAAAAILGPLFAGSVGLAAWRDALVSRLAGRHSSASGLALGVGIGLMLGKAASLQQSAAGLSGLRHPVWLLVIGSVGAGATLLSSGLGHVWADVAPRVRDVRTCWVVAFLANALLFTGLLWAVELFVVVIDAGGWAFARQGLVLVLSSRPIALMVLGLAGLTTIALALARRPADAAPRWLVEDGRSAPWPSAPRTSPTMLIAAGGAAGLVTVGAILAFRLALGPPTTDDEIIARVTTFEWLAGAVAATCVLVFAVIRPGWGAAGGLLAGVTSAVVVTAGFLTLEPVLGDGRFHVEKIELFLVPALCLGFFLGVAALPAAMLAPAGRREPSASAAVALLCAAAVVAAALVLPVRSFLVDQHPVSGPMPAPVVGEASSQQEVRIEVQRYVDEEATSISTEAGRIEAILDSIVKDDAPSSVRVRRLESEVLQPLQRLLATSAEFDAAYDDLDAVHDEAEAALRTAVERVKVIADYYRHGDKALAARTQELLDEENAHWERWLAKLRQLVDQVNA
jgi:hypothetical protein